jgi:hypothetical protein
MNRDTPQYYMPYDSENESGNDTGNDTDTDGESEDYDSDNLPDFEDARIRREEDPRYAIIAAAGPNFNTSAEQLKYMEHAPGASYDTSTNITNLSSLKYLDPPKTTLTSLFSIKSQNRDTSVWKTPFNFQLKTPRVYKNVTKFQLVQISFPNNTTNFINSPAFLIELANQLLIEGVSEDCLSTCALVSGCVPGATALGVAEPGRLNASKEPMYTTIPISNGQYTNSELADELNMNANNTPPFSVISYDTFNQEFKIHRDITILFNEPGDFFYTNVSKTKRGHHTKNDIMSTYYSNLHLDSYPIITDKIAFNAYYFPVLKEFVSLYTTTNVFIKTGSYTYKQVLDFVLGQFLGLDSKIYYDLCNDNRGTLDNYRKLHTFELKHVNKYIFSYNEHSRQFTVTHNSLHTSLHNDITNKYNALHSHSMSLKGLNHRSFQTLKTSYSHTNSVFNHLESHLSTQLHTCYALNNYKYTGGDLHCGIDNSGAPQCYTSTELDNDVDFTNMFPGFSGTFGAQLHGNYHGAQFTFTNFLDYHNAISSHYNTVINTSTLISSVHGFTNSNHHEYVSTKYTGILPHHVINNKSYIDSKGVGAAFLPHQTLLTPGEKIQHPYLAAESLSVVPPSVLSDTLTTPYSTCFTQCCNALYNIVRKWYSCIPVNTVINQFPAYRLGIDLLNVTSFNATASVLNTTSTTGFNLFLQINDFQSFNNMDVAMKENYSISNETTGQVKLMAAKLLLQGVGTGETSETAIQNPILFETPLGKLDKLDIKIYADDNSLTPMWQFFPFEIGINEWDATFQIDEQVALADKNAGFSGDIPTIPIPNNPNAFQYMGLTGGNNPDNK